jgi:PKD repeat protein
LLVIAGVEIMSQYAGMAQSIRVTVRASAVPSNGIAPLTVGFSASGSPPSAARLTSTYDWDFGDKGRGTGAVTRHTYTNPATYRATVIYTRFDNPQLRQQATNTVLVIVTNRPTVVTNRVPVVTNPPAILQVDPKTLLFNGKVGLSSPRQRPG